MHKIPAATEDQLTVLILEDVEDKLLPNNKIIGAICRHCCTAQNRKNVQQLTEHHGVHSRPNVIQAKQGVIIKNSK